MNDQHQTNPVTYQTIRFADLFCGIGGTRLGLENACDELGITSECVFSCDRKKTARTAYEANFSDKPSGDIRETRTDDIPDFDFLLAGFPCQPFSRAGMKRGFSDTRGTMFFEIERILSEKKPEYALLENVPEILTNDNGNTYSTVKNSLEAIGYTVSTGILDASDFGVPQKRKRAYITGNLNGHTIDFLDLLEKEKTDRKTFSDVMETDVPDLNDKFTRELLSSITSTELAGKVITDKRNGPNSLHSWDLGLFGTTNDIEKTIMNSINSEFRKKKYAMQIGVKWRDGMPLNISQISGITGITEQKLLPLLDALVAKGYLIEKHPYSDDSLDERMDLPVGYRPRTSRVSFELNRFLSKSDECVTLTATDASHIGVVTSTGVRRLTTRECLRLFGFPDSYDLSMMNDNQAYDLLGNSVCVPVVSVIAKRMLTNK